MSNKDGLKNILVTGANGQLGTSLAMLANPKDARFFFTDVAELDITNLAAVTKFVKDNGIDILINCAAYTNVDRAEDDYKTAELLNGKAPENLAVACKKAGAFLIHVSTDYVFGGGRSVLPYKEDAKENPTGVYGVTKLDGEKNIKKVLGDKSKKDAGNYLIIRTAWLYSEYGHNFVKTMLDLQATHKEIKVVFDQTGTPTYAADLAKAIYEIAMKLSKDDAVKYSGVYNYTNEGVCSWFDFAVAIGELGKRKCKVNPCHSDEFPSKVKRPPFSVLDKTKIKNTFGVEVPYWRDSLKVCIKNLLSGKNK
jgi:dTDP-4-dehydrorhamnose reductase